MNKRKIMAIVAVIIVLTLLTISIVEAGIFDTGIFSTIKSGVSSQTGKVKGTFSDYKFILANTILIAALLIAILSFYPEAKLGKKQRDILYVIAVAAAFVISLKMLPTDQFVWSIGNIKSVLHFKVIVNILVLTVAGFIIINLPKVDEKMPKKKMGLWGVYAIIIVIAFMVAVNPLKGPDGKMMEYDDSTYKYFWDRENIIPWRMRLLGDSNCYAFDGYGFEENKSTYLDNSGRSVQQDENGVWEEKKKIVFDGLKKDKVIDPHSGAHFMYQGQEVYLDDKGAIRIQEDKLANFNPFSKRFYKVHYFRKDPVLENDPAKVKEILGTVEKYDPSFENLLRKDYFRDKDGKKKYVGNDGNLRISKWFIIKDTVVSEDPAEIKRILGDVETYERILGGKTTLDELPDEQRKNMEIAVRDLDEQSKGGRYCYTQKSFDEFGQTNRVDYTAFKDKDPEIIGFGVLRGRQIIVLVLGTLMLIWLFQTLKVGADNNWIRYILAFILAANTAHDGIGWGTFIVYIEFITGFLLYRSMTGEGADRKKMWTNIAISAVLTDFIFRAAFPNDAIFIPIMSTMGITGKFILVLVVAVLGAAGVFGGAKGVKWLASKFGFKGTLSDLALAIGNPIIKGILKLPRPFRKIIRETWNWGPYTKTDQVPIIYQKYGHIICLWMDYMLRLEAFHGKYGVVQANVLDVKAPADELGKDFSKNRFIAHMDWFKNGARLFNFDNPVQIRRILTEWEEELNNAKITVEKNYIQNNINNLKRRFKLYNEKNNLPDGKKDLEFKELNCERVVDISNRYYDEHLGTIGIGKNATLWEQGKDSEGCLANHKLIIESLKEASSLNDEAIRTGAVEREVEELATSLSKTIKGKIDSMRKKINTQNKAHYYGYRNRYTNTIIMRAIELEMLDQYLIPGAYNHTYLFANPSAVIKYYNWGIRENDLKKSFHLKKEIKDKLLGDIELKGAVNPSDENLKSQGYLTIDPRKPTKGYEMPGRAGHLKFEEVVEGGEDEKQTLYDPFLHEVDYEGIFIDDYEWIKNAYIAGMGQEEIRKQKPYIRKLVKTWHIWNTQQKLDDDGKNGPTMVKKGNYFDAALWLDDVWKGFMWDMRTGEYHPTTRTFSDYKSSWELSQEYSFRDKKIEKSVEEEIVEDKKILKPEMPGKGAPSFDMEAFKSPAMVYWGVKTYNESNDTINNPPSNPYPAVSTMGMGNFIKFAYEKADINAENTKAFVEKFVEDTKTELLGMFGKPEIEDIEESEK